MTAGELNTRVRMPLRAWLVVEVFFGLAAISTVFLRPQDTATAFAWPIEPVVMAATLGAFYLATAPVLVIAVFVRTWQRVRVIVLPSVVFCTAMLLATLVHWDKFSVGGFPFLIWFASYVLPPPIFVWLYLWHQRHAAPVGAGIERPMAPWVCRLLQVNGLALTGIALVGFAFPQLLMAIGPWAITPLTARALCGWLLGVGLLQVSMAREGDWLRARLPTAQLILLPVAVLFQLTRFAGQVDWSNVPLWVLLADFTLVAAVCVHLWVVSVRQPVHRHVGVP